jgi:hypothetical protein
MVYLGQSPFHDSYQHEKKQAGGGHTQYFCPTQRAPDWWESARFQAVFVARSRFRQSSVVSSHPPAGNANRWAANHMID